MILANTLGEITVHFRAAADGSTLYFWLYAISYMLQIYYDFSGYSDMAIGLGKIFGFTFPENFSYPYIASSVTEFWRRWHISLGSWFRDYVYIPLGGNRRGLRRQLLNILVVWMLTGLWHGASWNFVLWGLYYGFFLMLEKLFLMPWLKKCVPVAHLYTLLVTVLGFVLFNANSLSQAVSDWAGLAGMNGSPLVGPEAIYYMRSYGPVILIGIVCATPLPEKIAAGLPEKLKAIAEPLFLTALLLFTTAFLVDGSFNPFLYFRF